jgi:adenosylcobinamide amidohydrolase
MIRPRLSPPWLQVDLGYRHHVIGWPLVGPATGEATTIAWLQVSDHDLPNDIAPDNYFRRRAKEAHIEADIGLMTSADITLHSWQTGRDSAMEVTAVVTAGLANGESVQPSPYAAPPAGWHAGTINILLHANVPLTGGAMIEAVSIVTEARTAALVDLELSLVDGRRLTGTGTDCILVAAPRGAHALHHAGLHTALGRLIGETTYRAVTEAVRVTRS